VKLEIWWTAVSGCTSAVADAPEVFTKPAITGVVCTAIVLLIAVIAGLILVRRRRAKRNSVDERAKNCEIREISEGPKASFLTRLKRRGTTSTDDDRAHRLEGQLLIAETESFTYEDLSWSGQDQEESGRNKEFWKKLSSIIGRGEGIGKDQASQDSRTTGDPSKR